MTANKSVLAPAKVNLTLHVTGLREDGYHLLDSLVVFANVGDRLDFTQGPELSMCVSGQFADGVPEDARNLAWRAAELAGWAGRISLEKSLPHGAGIGGGSSDAGALLRALSYPGSGLELGADVPVCKLGKAARMSGIGDCVEPIHGMPEIPAVLVNPGAHVPTPSVFKALTRKSNAPMDAFPRKGASKTDWLQWLKRQRNDLQAPAIETAPVIAQVLDAVAQTNGVHVSRMSGSGATCFGLYGTYAQAQAAARALTEQFETGWVVPTVLS